MFDHLVDPTEPICQKLNPALASMTIFATSGIEAWVTGNNPKYANRIIKQLKVFKKSHNLDEIVPVSFVSHFHAQSGRSRKHQLYPMLKALLLQRIFSIPTDTLLIVFLKYSQ